MTSFIALYQGETVASSRILAVTADPRLVSDFAARLLDERLPEPVERPVNRCEAGRQVITSEDKKRPTAGLEQVGREDGTESKEDSAYGRIIPK